MITAIYARKSTDQNIADEEKSVTRQVGRPAIIFFDALGRPTLEPDALWLELEAREKTEAWLRRQLEGLGKEPR